MKNLTPEMIEKAKAAKSVEELLALAKENEVEIPEEAAKALFEQLNPKSGELDDDDLDNVSGGGCGDNYDETKAQVGDHVYIKGGHTCIYCGAKDSAGLELLAEVRPKTAVISVGKDNPYGHPSFDVLERLEMFGCKILRTDIDGTILIRG